MININNLSFSYTGKEPFIINNVSLSIEKGSYVSIIGENGSCKSTLLKLMLSLLHPIKGSISINTNKIGYVPQKLDNFNSEFPISVSEILKNHCKILKIKDFSIINKVLRIVDLLKFKDTLIGSLSGGQQQRVFIARSLIGNPDLIVLDEPSTGVDSKNVEIIYSILRDLNKKDSKTILSVEHNIDIALKNSTHIVQVIEGIPTLYSKEDFILKLNNDINPLEREA
ncbi:MAG: metal ABC transporter ATP-binding protein [Clostridium sp.]|uniref:metal ABC transporter ATP-binding protein n=1 Tax=Clostridium sp. TaxID=1506 RepID=UPI003EE7217A